MPEGTGPIRYRTSLRGIRAEQLLGFFDGWLEPPSPETHLSILRNSDAVILAVEPEGGRVVGFINAITDRTLMAFIPLLEVLPDYRRRGIGEALVRRMAARLERFYAVDLVCDPALQRFYLKIGFMPCTAMALRRYDRQAGLGR